MSAIKTCERPEDLRGILDDLNETGVGYSVAGVTKFGAPFIASLAGPYAEVVVITWGNPWDSEVDYGTGTRCDECQAHDNADYESIAYPVQVIKA